MQTATTTPMPLTPHAAAHHMTAALHDAAACALAKYPGEQARIERGLQLALAGHVTLLRDEKVAIVRSADGRRTYTVNGFCECLDFSRAPEGRCKHRWSKALTVKARKFLGSTYYATLDGAVHGTARQTDGGWLFRADDGTEAHLPHDSARLALGGDVWMRQPSAPLWQVAGAPQYADQRQAVAQYTARMAARTAQREAR